MEVIGAYNAIRGRRQESDWPPFGPTRADQTRLWSGAKEAANLKFRRRLLLFVGESNKVNGANRANRVNVANVANGMILKQRERNEVGPPRRDHTRVTRQQSQDSFSQLVCQLLKFVCWPVKVRVSQSVI